MILQLGYPHLSCLITCWMLGIKELRSSKVLILLHLSKRLSIFISLLMIRQWLPFFLLLTSVQLTLRLHHLLLKLFGICIKKKSQLEKKTWVKKIFILKWLMTTMIHSLLLIVEIRLSVPSLLLSLTWRADFMMETSPTLVSMAPPLHLTISYSYISWLE